MLKKEKKKKKGSVANKYKYVKKKIEAALKLPFLAGIIAI